MAIIMDGNGRWAQRRGLPRSFGHRAGAGAVRRVVNAAVRLGVDTLTLYAFSCDNWKRPRAEIRSLMRLLRSYLEQEAWRCRRNGVRVRAIGHRHRLDPELTRSLEECERSTAGGREMTLRLAIDYSSRQQLARAASRVVGGTASELERELARLDDPEHETPGVDLLIRTSGERRLSDFLLWECAYAELLFVDTLWPDFGEHDLEAALIELGRRQRRFGAVPEAAERPLARRVEAVP